MDVFIDWLDRNRWVLLVKIGFTPHAAGKPIYFAKRTPSWLQKTEGALENAKVAGTPLFSVVQRRPFDLLVFPFWSTFSVVEVPKG